MAKCLDCGGKFWNLDLKFGLCAACLDKQNEAKKLLPSAAELAEVSEALRKQIDAILLTAEVASDSLRIEKRLGFITAECAYGMHLFKDLFIEVRDMVGGRSRSIEKTLADARETALSELRVRAHGLGANAVIAIDLDYSEFGRSMLLVVASGTAVRLEE
ncbi:MAG: hypothetical protein BGP11_16120 [Rhodobacterales bacterium 65-51]|uniref:YbjQ family protein n=1 Tax=uncultured Gemmobacter sp. TaxID=1095917 RepID=UPI00095A0DDA|nr:YbjQ family protein [uncultured Gemmobacter sp.]OJY34634.1 MAG: hypothetical protein BGP11_16120 [Rhodobacterales bacterium 65-51]